MGTFALISHHVDSSQQSQTNVELVSHPPNQNAPCLCVSQCWSSAHTMTACLPRVYKFLKNMIPRA